MRIIALLFTAFFVVGFSQMGQPHVRSPSSQDTVATTDCSRHRWSYGLRDDVMLRVFAIDAADKFRRFLALATFRDSQTREEADKTAQAKADEANREFDRLMQQAEEEKKRAGNCFGKGEYDKKVAESYALTQKTIAEQRKTVADGLEEVLVRNRTIDEERSNFERWRAENQEMLVRQVGGMKLEIVRIAKRDRFGRPASNTVITVEATNTTTFRILKPRNRDVVGGRLTPMGASLMDSFGNEYKLTSITPRYLGSEVLGIRPGQTVTFELRFGDVPIKNAESVRLNIAPGTFGQEGGTRFELPSEAFYGTTTKS